MSVYDFKWVECSYISNKSYIGHKTSYNSYIGLISYIFIQMYSRNDLSYKIQGKFRFFLKMHNKIPILPKSTQIQEIFSQNTNISYIYI